MAHPPERRTSTRCAIYTRKSTEEGLEQAFNSLDAQREACMAYIASQKHEGWSVVPDLYDDGGFSGGTMDRPGLAHLLADVRAGKVDIIVVYKVDRLTRSLADFAKIVEVLDGCSASFVSVTQAFNTTTSMGRLTLNVLLSFAQFEREVTGERIRDKIAASKARGMWMGGVVPLGYEVVDRKLVICELDAETVRMIFQRYLALGSVLALQAALSAQNVRSRTRISRAGKTYGNTIFSRGALYLMLKNRIYLGQICHKGKAYPGEHAAVIDANLFEAVATKLEQNRIDTLHGTRADQPSLLTGLIWDGEGRRMSPSHACKATKRYRYYVSRQEPSDRKMPLWRVPAGDLEHLVIASLRSLPEVADTVALDQPIDRQWLQQTVTRIAVRSDRILVSLTNDKLAEPLSIPAAVVRRGKETRLALAPDGGGARLRDPSLIKLVVKAHVARDALRSAGDRTIAELAKAHGYTRDYFGVLLRISYLAPDIVGAILDGRQPVQLNRQRLARATNLPLDWPGQRRMLGFA
jgi:site-specific DNA recombinase